MKELSQDNGLDLHVAPDQTVDEAELLALVGEVHPNVLGGVETDAETLLPTPGHLEHEAPPVHERGDLGDPHALRVQACKLKGCMVVTSG